VYARTATVHGDPKAIDDGVAFLRDRVMPAVEGLPGYVGLSMLADRDTGRCIATTSWKDEAAMAATGEQLRPLRTRFAEMLGGEVELRTWEIAVVHRVHEAPDGACTRVTWTRTDPSRVERALDAYRVGLLPRLEELDGFCSASLLVDRRDGRAAGSVTYADRMTLERSRTDATAVREEFAATMDSQIVEVAEFDLVLAHLRVPETA
jgi:heme-degrading monooxygenase HmoA